MQTTINRKIFFLGFLFTTSLLLGQSGEITYTYHSYGDYERPMTLLISSNQSLFTFEKKRETITNEKGWQFHHYDEYYEVFTDLSNDVVSAFRLYNKTELNSSWKITELQWEITEEIKYIDSIKVQKAITKSIDVKGTAGDDYENPFHGNAIAWFAPDIPIFSGPGLYHGLPGLIVKLEYSNRSNIFFQLESIVYKPIDIQPTSKKGIPVSKMELIRPFDIDKKWLKRQRKQLNSN